jgi:hypothetical protein
VFQDKGEKADRKTTQNIISKIFPKREIAKIPSEFRATKKAAATKTSVVTPTAKASAKGNLVWTRKKLPASSVQLSPGGNPTGGLRLVQDDFIVVGHKIDQTSYFRNTLFGNFKWRQIRNTPYVEAATVPFEVTIKGKFLGKHDLEIRHKPSGEAGQHNYTTSISWGSIGETIRKSNLTGARLELYSPKGRSKSFQIIIT